MARSASVSSLNPARVGSGKAPLLESIRDTGSISAAARDMGMSYKRAWLLLDSINQAFTEPVVRAATGGAGGGGATPTPFSAEGLERYCRVRDEANRVVADNLAVLALARRGKPDRRSNRSSLGMIEINVTEAAVVLNGVNMV